MSNLSLKYLLLAATVAIAGTFSCRQAEELSSEAEIVSFTFDTSVDANSIVTSQPVINGDSITFSVSSDSVSERLSALVPTITVSENATVSPASGSAVDFSQGTVTFTVTAQDGVTTRAYFAKAVTGTTDNPETAGAADFTEFSFDLNYVKDYDPAKTYKLAVIFAASKEGNQYRAASGSIMIVDNVTIICE